MSEEFNINAFYKEILSISYDQNSDILMLKWNRFDISLDDSIKAHDLIFKYITIHGAKKIIVDTSLTSGSLSPELLEYSNNIVYPTIFSLGVKKIGIVVPFESKAQMSTSQWEVIYYKNIEIKNFLLPSNASKWLSVD